MADGLNGDLDSLGREELRAEIIKLRAEIRYHRDQRGHDRCWLDDVKLYRALPETTEAEFPLPERSEFLTNCARYWETRQPCPKSPRDP